MIHTETASTYPDLVGEKVISGLEDDEMAHSLNDYVRAIYKLDVSDTVTLARSLLLHRLIRSFDLDMGMAWNRRVPSSFAVSHQFGSFITELNDRASSTSEYAIPESLKSGVNTIFGAASEENFESGVESEFSRKLLLIIEKYGELAIRALGLGILANEWNPEVISEALRWIARIADPSTYASRLWLLERSLFSPHSRIRDGAALGLASLDDPSAIPYLEAAIAREPIRELRGDLEQALDQLRATLSESTE